MTAMFEIPIASETLDTDELTTITGCPRKGEQVEWLTTNGWVHHRTRAGAPVVGRLYARLKLAGITPAAMAGGWSPDLSGVR